MKKLLTASMLILSAHAANALAVENGTISYEGLVTGGTCDVTVNGGTADGTVTLVTVTADDLNAKKEAGKTPFHFVFSHCAGTLKYVRPYFETGSTVDSSNAYLKNVGGTATGVDFILRSPDGNQIKPGTATQGSGFQWTSGADLTSDDYTVSYITDSTIGPAIAGTVDSSVIYHLEYY
ncbi:MAG: fimbrial protein [Scandinavium sp.]|uniref:fimbrial protein n=1 Tax=Scandinavium sp. TaxID=2830653 RepID=UPI003F39C19D